MPFSRPPLWIQFWLWRSISAVIGCPFSLPSSRSVSCPLDPSKAGCNPDLPPLGDIASTWLPAVKCHSRIFSTPLLLWFSLIAIPLPTSPALPSQARAPSTGRSLCQCPWLSWGHGQEASLRESVISGMYTSPSLQSISQDQSVCQRGEARLNLQWDTDQPRHLPQVRSLQPDTCTNMAQINPHGDATSLQTLPNSQDKGVGCGGFASLFLPKLSFQQRTESTVRGMHAICSAPWIRPRPG